MTVAELIAILEDFDGDAEVRLAQQPSWPFEYSIARFGVEIAEVEGADVVYIAEGSQLGYLPGVARDAIGWGDR